MKKIYLLLGLLIASYLSINAQITTDLKVEEKKVDDLLINVDKSKITNGILYERVYPLSRLKRFNEFSSDTTNHKNFLQTYSEIYRSSEDKSKFYDIDKFRDDKQNMYLDKLNIWFGILNIDYSSLNINENEKLSGLKLENEKLYPIEGKDPFIKNRLVMVSPFIGTVIGNHTNFKFDSKYFIQISDNNIETLTFEIENQKFDVIESGRLTKNDYNIQFSTAGDKIIKFDINFKNENRITTYARLSVVFPEQVNRITRGLIEDGNITADLPFQGYSESIPRYGHIQYRIYYRTNDGVNPTLKKPIIVVDGFDPMDNRKFEDEDCRLNSSCFDFYDGNMINHHSFREGFYYGTDYSKDVLSQLQAKGYDVILVNQPTHRISQNASVTIDGGADYIERNARAFVKLIQTINQRLLNNGSNEKLVIIGPSMGGQITRYALAYMEKNNLSHNTRLWLSIDSPHNGANIPMAVQANIHFLGWVGNGDEQARIMYNNMLKSTAAKQMLIYQLNETNPTTFYSTYYNNLYTNGLPNSNGFPLNLRKIAIANGSMTGVTNGSPNQKVLDYPGFKRILGFDTKVANSEEWFLPNNGTNQTYYKGLTTVVDWYFLGVSITQYTSTYRTNQNDIRGSIDASPGGRFYATQMLYESIGKGYRDNDVRGELRSLQGFASFIPTISALAFKNTNFNWSNSVNRNLVCSNETYFDSYYAPRENQQHTSFTDENVAWAFGEIDHYNMLPTSYINPMPQISGLSEINYFPENEYTLYLSGINNVTNINWTFPSDKIQLISGQGTMFFRFRILTEGMATIYVTYFDSCSNSNVTISKTISLKRDNLSDITLNGSDNLYLYGGYCTYSYTLSNAPINATYNWEFSLNRLFGIGNTGNVTNIVVGAHTWGSAFIKVTIIYNGQVRIINKNINIYQTGVCWNPTAVNNSNIAISPNPSKPNQSVNVLVNFENKQNDKVELSVYNQFGVKVSSSIIDNKQSFNLDTSKYNKRGIYIIKAVCENEILTEKLIIEE